MAKKIEKPAEEVSKFPSKEELDAARNQFLNPNSDESGEISKVLENHEEKVVENQEKIEKKEKELSDIEKIAIKKGWRPKEQFTGDEDKWRDAQTWVDRSDLYDRIDSQKSYIKRLEEQQQQILAFLTSREKREAEAEKNILRSRRIEAIKQGNVEEVDRIDQEINKIGSEFNNSSYQEPKTEETKIATSSSSNPPEVNDFIERNKSWLNKDTEENEQLAYFAIAREQLLTRRNPNMPLAEKLMKVEEYIKENFLNKNIANVSPVEGRRNKPVNDRDVYPSFDVLHPDVKNIIDFSVSRYNAKCKDKNKMRNRDFYIKEMVKTKAIDREGRLIDARG